MMMRLSVSEAAEGINTGGTKLRDLELECSNLVADGLFRTMAGFWGCTALKTVN